MAKKSSTNKSKLSSRQPVQEKLLRPSSPNRHDRRLILNIYLFLLGKEKMKDTYWTISGVKYLARSNRLTISVRTIDNKMGTTLKNMRSHVADLAYYLKTQGLTSQTPKISIKADKDADYLFQLNQLINQVEEGLKM